MRAPWTTPPPFGSSAPNRSALIRATETAAAHIAQGSSVTHKVHSSSRERAELLGCGADRRHLGMRRRVVRSAHRIAALRRSISSPSVTTAPTGTSPASAASRASSSARRIGGRKRERPWRRRLAEPAAVSSRYYCALLVTACCLVCRALNLERRDLDRRFLAADGHRAGLDVERRRLAALADDAVVRGRNLGARAPRIWLMSRKPMAIAAMIARMMMIRIRMTARIGRSLCFEALP